MTNQNRLYDLLREGKSFSGHERNCCFLNIDGSRFANASAVSGFDYMDDARSMVLADWDHDGDQDVWLGNRTAPRVRFLRNDTPSTHHYLSLRLQGTSCNRDAIGARVQVVPMTTSHTVLVKSLRAGEGFLGQSSKWLHFGLGSFSGGMVKVIVRWPSGTAETFLDVPVDGRYRLIQGTGRAHPESNSGRALSLAARSSALPKPSPSVRAVLVRPIPMPRMHYQTWQGVIASLDRHVGKPLLLNLWASWCQPCRDELSELTKRKSQLKEVEVLALSVDGLAGDQQSNLDAAKGLINQLDFPFSSGVAPLDLLDKLQLIHDQLFGLSLPLPVPTNLLFDRSGQLVAVYKGRVDFDRLVSDVSTLAVPTLQSAPHTDFAGRWFRSPDYNLALLTSKLVAQDYLEEALDYIETNLAQFPRDTSFATVQAQLGWKLLERGKLADAEIHFRQAVAIDGNDANFRHGLAMALSKQERRDEAIRQLNRAVRIDPQHTAANISLADELRVAGNLKSAQQFYIRAIETDPENAHVHQNLGVAYFAMGDFVRAIPHFRVALRLDPRNAGVQKNLGVALAATGRRREAIKQFEQCLTLSPGDAAVHNNLSGLYVGIGDIEVAQKHIETAVRIQPENVKYRRNLSRIRAMGGRR